MFVKLETSHHGINQLKTGAHVAWRSGMTGLDVRSRGVVGRRRGDGVPHFFERGGDASPTPPLFGLKFVQKFSTAELISICYRHSNTSSCIAGQDQRSAVVIFLTCMSVRVCRPKLFKNLCLSLVSGVPPLLFRTTPLIRSHRVVAFYDRVRI